MKHKTLLLAGRIALFALLFLAVLTPVFAEGLHESAPGPAGLMATDSSLYSMASTDHPLTASQPEGFRVTLIGSGLPKLDLDKIGPSMLVEYQGTKILVDCGYEAMTGLMKVGINPTDITHLLFTHQHADHNADFVAFFIGGWDGQKGRRELSIAGPGTQALYDSVLGFYGEDLSYRINVVGSPSDGIYTNVDINDFTDDYETLEIDGIKISAIPVPHTIKTYAFKFEAGGQSVVITGDMTYNEQIKDFAAGADIVVIDALQAADFSDIPEKARAMVRKNLSRSHIMNEDIAEIAATAQMKNLVLAHWAGDLTLQNSIDLYRAAGYTGEVTKGVDGMVIEP